MNFFKLIEQSLLACGIEDKINSFREIQAYLKHASLDEITWDISGDILDIKAAGIPQAVKLVAPSEVRKRNYASQEGYAALLHSICHIEFNAINLALDAAYRFRLLPKQFTLDWLKVAKEEVYHFSLMRARLQSLGVDYGDFEAHNNLWDMAYKTSYDPLARMALVPRVLEARGLDVTPGMKQKVAQRKDFATCDVLDIIYNDEIGHVRIGNHWFRYIAQMRNLDPISLFRRLISRYELFIFKGYVNWEARQEAGFSELELALLEDFESSFKPQKRWRYGLWPYDISNLLDKGGNVYYTERFNAYSHLVGLILVIASGSVLLVYSGMLADPYKIVANSLFVASMIILYAGSFMYHSIREPNLKKAFQKIDHVAIYILIAGSYAPFMLVALRGGWGWSILGVIWFLAVIGIIQEFVFKAEGTRPISLIIYLAMGWLGFIAIKPVWEALNAFSLTFLVLGGLFYTIGVYWYVNDEKIKHGHGIWHVFVLLGTLSHMASVYGVTYYN